MNVLREILREKAMATFLIALSAGFVQSISEFHPHKTWFSAKLAIAWKCRSGRKPGSSKT
jgi:hypothetical protein